MQPILSVAAMRTCDENTIQSGVSSKILMRRAGESIWNSRTWNGEIAIVTGSGNNAGDGYVLALLLHQAGKSCRLVRLSEKCSPDGAFYFQQCCAAGIPCTHEVDFSQTDVIVDCILGTGFHGNVRPEFQTAIQKINAASATVISVDINSGINGDTGTGSCCVQADETVSIGYIQYGHLIGMARGWIGTLRNYDIGIACTETYMPFYSVQEHPMHVERRCMEKSVLIQAKDFAAYNMSGKTLKEQMTAYAQKESCVLALYGEQFVLLCDNIQACAMETAFDFESYKNFFHQKNSMSDCIAAISEYNQQKSGFTSRIVFH